MCLAIPTKIVDLLPESMLLVSVGESENTFTVSGALLPEAAEIGDYIIVHAGFALHKMDRSEAEESLRLFREISEAAGDTPNF